MPAPTDHPTRQKTSAAIFEAEKEWAKAPMHIKAMAGAYVVPLLAALAAINTELQARA